MVHLSPDLTALLLAHRARLHFCSTRLPKVRFLSKKGSPEKSTNMELVSRQWRQLTESPLNLAISRCGSGCESSEAVNVVDQGFASEGILTPLTHLVLSRNAHHAHHDLQPHSSCWCGAFTHPTPFLPGGLGIHTLLLPQGLGSEDPHSLQVLRPHWLQQLPAEAKTPTTSLALAAGTSFHSQTP